MILRSILFNIFFLSSSVYACCTVSKIIYAHQNVHTITNKIESAYQNNISVIALCFFDAYVNFYTKKINNCSIDQHALRSLCSQYENYLNIIGYLHYNKTHDEECVLFKQYGNDFFMFIQAIIEQRTLSSTTKSAT